MRCERLFHSSKDIANTTIHVYNGCSWILSKRLLAIRFCAEARKKNESENVAVVRRPMFVGINLSSSKSRNIFSNLQSNYRGLPNEHIIILKWKWPCQWLQCPCHCRMKWFFEKCPSEILPISVLFLKKLESRFWDQITKRYLCNCKSKHSINIYIYKWMNLIESKTAHKSPQNWTTGSEDNDWPCVSLGWVEANTNFSIIQTVTTSMSWAWLVRKSFHGTSKMDAFPISSADVARFREVKSFDSMTPLKWQNARAKMKRLGSCHSYTSCPTIPMLTVDCSCALCRHTFFVLDQMGEFPCVAIRFGGILPYAVKTSEMYEKKVKNVSFEV